MLKQFSRQFHFLLALLLLTGSGLAHAAAAAAPAPASAASAPIEANGLIAQLLKQLAHWADGLSDQVVKLAQAVRALPAALAWLVQTFSSPAGQALGIKAVVALAAVFVVGVALEWGVRWLLRRPRKALLTHAEEVERRALERERQAAELRKLRHQEALSAEAKRPKEAEAAATASPTGNKRAVTTDAAASAVTSPTERRQNADAAGDGRPDVADATQSAPSDEPETAPNNVALVRTQVDGVERIEAVKVNSGDGGSGRAEVMPEDDALSEKQEAGDVPNDVKVDQTNLAKPAEHWGTLRHLPYAIATLVLDLLPLVVFFIAAGLLLRWLGAGQRAVQDMTEGFINAYLTTRVTLAVIRLLVSPSGHGLRVLRVAPHTARIVEIGVRRVVVLAAFGIALANAGGAFGASNDSQIAFMKVVSLLVHISAVILIIRTRQAVASLIAAPRGATGPWAGMRNWLADIWAFFASFVVMAVWVVWALGVQNGFPRLIHFIWVSASVIVLARLLAVLLLGALGRVFRHKEERDDVGAAQHIADRYYPIARSVVSAVIIVGTGIALLESWGVNSIAWFTRGTVGRSLTSATTTIAIAAIVAIAVWELTNLSVDKRIARWTESGDKVRAARLRTLVPMLRTCLFIVIVLVVGLTALNEIGINTAPLLAGASIIGVALGFGSQKLVQDFITGIFLLMENAMQVGDYVTLASVSGTVEYLSIRTVRLRGSDGSLYIVPFSSVTTVNNVNRGLGNAAVRVSVAYDSDIDQVIAVLNEVGASIRADEKFNASVLGDLELWGVDSVDGSMVTVAGQMRCLDSGRWGVQREFNRRIFERFRELGIEIANPRASLLLPVGASAAQAAGSADGSGGGPANGIAGGVANAERVDSGSSGTGAASPAAHGPHGASAPR